MRNILAVAALLLASVAGASASFAPLSFAVTNVRRFVTPNKDLLNDTAVFTFSNPQDSVGVIRIFDLRGRQVATVPIDPNGPTRAGCPNETCAEWNPSGFAGGVYLYVLTIDKFAKSGTIVVVK